MRDAVRLQRTRGRVAAGLALIEGPTVLAEAAAAGAEIRTVFRLERDHASRDLAAGVGAEDLVVTEAVLERVATTDSPQSPVAVVAVPEASLPRTGDVLVAWGVGDPGNVGTLLRTAAAFAMSFAVGPGTADPWSPKVVRSGAGAHFRCPPVRIADLGLVRPRITVATVPDGGVAPEALPPCDVAILVGDEAGGLPEAVIAAADVTVTIPMPGGTESLNAAVAGAIVAYQAARRRAGGDSPKG